MEFYYATFVCILEAMVWVIGSFAFHEGLEYSLIEMTKILGLTKKGGLRGI